MFARYVLLQADVPADVECLVCFDMFDHPQSLPCGHSICGRCVDAIAAARSECPVCWGSFAGVEVKPNYSLPGYPNGGRVYGHQDRRIAAREEEKPPCRRRGGTKLLFFDNVHPRIKAVAVT